MGSRVAIAALLVFAMGCGDATGHDLEPDAGVVIESDSYPKCPSGELDWVASLKCSGKMACEYYGQPGKYTIRMCKCSDGGSFKQWWTLQGRPCATWSGLMKWGEFCDLKF